MPSGKPSINEARNMTPARVRALTEKAEMAALGASILDFLERPETKRSRGPELRRALMRSVVWLKVEADDLADGWDDAA